MMTSHLLAARRAAWSCVVLLCCLAPTRVSAQIVEEGGIARDEKLGTPLECLHVALLDSTGMPVAHTVTDSAGQFLLDASRPGRYRVQFQIFGWEPLVGPLDTLADGASRQRIYPLSFANMLDPDSTAERPSYVRARSEEYRAKARIFMTELRKLESDSTWRSHEVIPTKLDARYPEGLMRLGIQGAVLSRFIVDTTGSARPESWQSLAVTQPAFEATVRGSLPKARWKPARLAGRPTCELVMDLARFYREGDRYYLDFRRY